MMTIVRRTEKGPYGLLQGSPDVLLKRCAARVTLDGQTEALDDEHRQLIGEANASLAQQALRGLGVVYRCLGQPASLEEEVECDLVFLGLLQPVRLNSRSIRLGQWHLP